MGQRQCAPAWLGAGHDVMHGLLARRGPYTAVTKAWEIETGEERLAGAEQARGNRDVHLVHKAGFEVLPNGGGAAEQADVLVPRCGPRAVQRGMDTVGHEMEDGAALHLLRRPRVVREHECRSVIRRILSPPSAPRVIGPRSAYRAEHVATENERTHVRHATLGEVVVDAGGAALALGHLHEHARADQPLVQFLPSLPQWNLFRLVRPGAVAIERDRKAVYDQSRHEASGAAGT